MSTFFSGTDTATLKEEGTDRNNFVSLIVNNAGTYTAAITRRIKSKHIKEDLSYEFFGDGERHSSEEYESNEDEIEWFYLKIEKEEENYTFPEIESRLKEINQAKLERAKRTQTSTFNYTSGTSAPNRVDKWVLPSKAEEGDLPFDRYEIPYGKVNFDKTIIKSLVLQLISSSVIVSNDDRIDPSKWAKSMPALYEERFGKGESGMEKFKIWADTYVEYLVWYASDEKLAELGFDESEICAICAHDMIEELTKLPENDYINIYIDTLQKYLVL